MEPKRSKVQTGPPKLIDGFVWRPMPPAVREPVVGDLYERYRSPISYLADALRIFPYVVVSRIRRTTTTFTVGVQGIVLFGCLGGFGEVTGVTGAIPTGLKAAIPTLIASLALLLRDAYSVRDDDRRLRLISDLLAVIVCVGGYQLCASALAAFGQLDPGWTFTPDRMVVASLSILPTLFVFRSGLRVSDDSPMRRMLRYISMDALTQDYRRFARQVSARNRTEILVFGATALASAVFLIIVSPPIWIAAIGWSWIVGQAIAIWFVYTRASALPVPNDADFPASVATYRQALSRQRRHVRVMWWWYLLPMFPGVGVPALARGAAQGDITLVVLGCVYIALLAFVIGKFAQGRANEFKAQMDALSRVEERPANP